MSNFDIEGKLSEQRVDRELFLELGKPQSSLETLHNYLITLASQEDSTNLTSETMKLSTAMITIVRLLAVLIGFDTSLV